MKPNYQTLLQNCQHSSQLDKLVNKTVHILSFPYDFYVQEHHKSEHSLGSSYEILDIFVHFEKLLFFINCVDVLYSDNGQKILVIIKFANITEFNKSLTEAKVEMMLEINDSHFFYYIEQDVSTVN